MIKSLLLVGLGGALGSLLRFICQRLAIGWLPVIFPFGTFLVNIVGCFVIGVVYSALDPQVVAQANWRVFLMTGLCGGFTTFSSFSLESIALLRQGDYGTFLLYAGGSILLGLLATIAGIWVNQ